MISVSILDEFKKKDIKLDSKQVEFLNLVEVSIKQDNKILSAVKMSRKGFQNITKSIKLGKKSIFEFLTNSLA